MSPTDGVSGLWMSARSIRPTSDTQTESVCIAVGTRVGLWSVRLSTGSRLAIATSEAVLRPLADNQDQ